MLEELNKLDRDQLGRIAEIWEIPKIPSEKRSIINALMKVAQDEYYIKQILEKLTPVQVKIYALIVSNRSVLTLGEISRKVLLQPINVEKELMVLKHLMLVYQRKNRERITNNLDKYYPFEEIRGKVSVDTNQHGEKFQLSIKKEIEFMGINSLDKKYRAALKKGNVKKDVLESAIQSQTFAKILKGLNEGEIVLLDEAFSNGGILEISSARIIMAEQKLPIEKTLRKLHELFILRDIYFIDERFVRLMVIPVELYEYLRESPVFPKVLGIKEQQQKCISNELDFVLNLKRMLLFISRKGLTLSQSERLKQADMKKSEKDLIDIDSNLFPEKSQIHQIEIILPFLKMFDLVDLKEDHVVLKESYEDFLVREALGMIRDIIEGTAEASERRMVGNEVFLPIDLPFYKRPILERCLQALSDVGGLYVKVLISELIREWVILSPGFRVRNFKTLYIEKRGEIVSALYYMHLFGLLTVEYPRRFVKISDLGRHYFFGDLLPDDNIPGGVIINPDATLIALPDKLSLHGTHLLKSFAELREFDRVYNFQITKESLQDALLLGNKIEEFLKFLEHVSKNRIPQNLTFLISEWSEQLPIVTIEEGVVLLGTSDKKLTELLLGQIKGKKIVKKELSDTAMIIYKNRVQEVMEIAEKLEMIVKLVR